MTEEKSDFVCRICGCAEYEQKYQSLNNIIGSGYASEKTYCICRGCSIIFEKPEKFSATSATNEDKK